jgi:hypothetical protein
LASSRANVQRGGAAFRQSVDPASTYADSRAIIPSAHLAAMENQFMRGTFMKALAMPHVGALRPVAVGLAKLLLASTAMLVLASCGEGKAASNAAPPAAVSVANVLFKPIQQWD